LEQREFAILSDLPDYCHWLGRGNVAAWREFRRPNELEDLDQIRSRRPQRESPALEETSKIHER
jgi:hypothetical protein